MSGKCKSKRFDYISQNESTCGEALWAGCGLVSLVNSLLFMDITSQSSGSREVYIWRSYKIGQDLELFDENGLSPAGLKTLCANVCRTWGLTVTLHETCDDSDLCPGMLLFVSSVALLNAQDCGEQFEQEDVNSHIVMLESVEEAGLVVINPDRRKRRGGGFIEGKWGRMFIPVSSVTQVWQCVHQVGTTTTRCAISIRHRDSCIWYRHDPLLGMNLGMVCTCFLKEDCECAPIRQLVIRELKDRADALDYGVHAAGYGTNEWIHSNMPGGESLLHERCECSSKRNEVIHMLYHRITLRDNNLFAKRLPRIRKEFNQKARKEYAALRASELAKSCSSSLDLSMSYKSSDSDSAFDCKVCASNTSAMESTYSAMGRIGGEVSHLKKIGNANVFDSNDVTKTMEQLVAENVELKSKMRLMTEKICSIEDMCDELIAYYIRELHFK